MIANVYAATVTLSAAKGLVAALAATWLLGGCALPKMQTIEP